MPILSVVVPNYNDADVLPRAIYAILNQSHRPDEIIIVDDGSTDNSKDVIDRLVSQIPIVRAVFLPNNVGVIRAMNVCLAEARGRYIYFASANDEVEPSLFRTAVDLLEKCPGSAFFCSEVRVCNTAGRQMGVRPPATPSQIARCFSQSEALSVVERLHNFAPSSGVVFDRLALLKEGGFLVEMETFADGFAILCLAISRGFCFSPKIGGQWVRDPDSVSSSTAADPGRILVLLEKVKGSLAARQDLPKGFLCKFERRWRFTFGQAMAGGRADALAALGPVVAPGRIEGVVWGGLSVLPGFSGKLMRLVWLFIRWRPYALTPVIFTQVRRLLSARTYYVNYS